MPFRVCRLLISPISLALLFSLFSMLKSAKLLGEQLKRQRHDLRVKKTRPRREDTGFQGIAWLPPLLDLRTDDVSSSERLGRAPSLPGVGYRCRGSSVGLEEKFLGVPWRSLAVLSADRVRLVQS